MTGKRYVAAVEFDQDGPFIGVDAASSCSKDGGITIEWVDEEGRQAILRALADLVSQIHKLKEP